MFDCIGHTTVAKTIKSHTCAGYARVQGSTKTSMRKQVIFVLLSLISHTHTHNAPNVYEQMIDVCSYYTFNYTFCEILACMFFLMRDEPVKKVLRLILLP